MSKSSGGQPLQRVFFEAVVIAVLATAIGLGLNYRMMIDAFAGRSLAVSTSPQQIKQPHSEAQGTAIFPAPATLDEIDELVADGAVLIDARNTEVFSAGHLADAVSLPFSGEQTDLDWFRRRFDTQTTLVTYCSGYGCPDSYSLAELLIKAGYQDVMVYEGGYPEWRDSGRAIEKGEK